MERCAEELHRCWGKKLRCIVPSRFGAENPAKLLSDRWREISKLRGDQRREVEGGKNSETVACGEERIGQLGDLCGGRRRRCCAIEHFCEVAIFVNAEGHVHSRSCCELHGAGRYGVGWLGPDCRGESVDAVGCKVGTEVEREDEEEGFGCEEGVRPSERGNDGVAQTGCKTGAGRGFCDNGAERRSVSGMCVSRV